MTPLARFLVLYYLLVFPGRYIYIYKIYYTSIDMHERLFNTNINTSILLIDAIGLMV